MAGQGNGNASTPIHAVWAGESLQAALDGLDEDQQRWVELQGFTGEAFSWVTVPDGAGGIAAVLAGANPQAPLQALAALPAALPAGDYRLDSEHDPHWRRQAALGWSLASYRFERYLSEPPPPRARLVGLDDCAGEVEALAAATGLVRDLINTPTDDMGPDQLQAAVAAEAAKVGAAVETIRGKELEQEYPAIHAVGRASHRPPRLIRLRWGDKTHPRLAIVGKGVCFDTGGLNLKGASGMRRMKKDMGGAAHALALARLVMGAGLPVSLELYIPAVENAVAAEAYRPGDVVATRKGLSVEIGNTDAEGRVILADALTAAGEAEPAAIIDFATLTGAARIALGADLPALFGCDLEMRSAIHAAGDREEDPVWPLPLYQPYARLLKSDIADLCNQASSSYAGCITAALFLQRFVPEDVPWCHFDVYGWNDEDRAGRPKGGEAMALRATWAWLQERFGSG